MLKLTCLRNILVFGGQQSPFVAEAIQFGRFVYNQLSEITDVGHDGFVAWS